MMQLHPTHLDDGSLVRLLDREASPLELERLHLHLDGCATCADRVAVLERRSRRLSALLAETAPAPRVLSPPRLQIRPRRGRYWLRAAAVVVVALGLAATARPVRAWLSEQIAAGWARVAGETPSEAAALPAPSAPEAGTTVSFAPERGEFRLELAAQPAGGRLTVEWEDAAEVTVHIAGSKPELQLLPDGMRVENAPDARLDLHLSLPAGLPAELRVDGKAPVPLRPEGPGTLEMGG